MNDGMQDGLIHQSLKVPPHSVEAEQAVIGGLMISPDSWGIVADLLVPEDFYRVDHRHLFKVIAELRNNDQPADVITMSERLKESGDLEQAGGLVYLGTMAKDTPSAANIRAYASIVKERALLRRTIQACEKAISLAYAPAGATVASIVDDVQRELLSVNEGSDGGGPLEAKKFVGKYIETLDRRSEEESPITGLRTGFKDIDERTLGLQPGDMIVVAGRPSMGKTTFAMNIADNVARIQKLPTLVFSVEMPGEQLIERLTSSVTEIPYNALRKGNLSAEEWPKATTAFAEISGSPLYVDEAGNLNINQLRSRARQMKNKHDIRLIVIDYISLMSSPASGDNRTRQLGDISRGIKTLAKELKIPIIVLAQLNRDCEKRPDKRPVMADLRDCGEIEQDADVIVFMYRDVIYNENTKYPNLTEVLFRKFRNGMIGRELLTAALKYNKFRDYTDERPVYEAPAKKYSEGVVS